MGINSWRLPALHAATVCETYQRSKLERLCRYITRPPIATRRLSVDDRGRVMYRYKQPFRDGSTHVVLEPLDFIARLVALVPRPRLNLTRFHGVFAPNFRHRARIVPRRSRGRVDSDKPRAPLSWMQRLKRVFAIDIQTSFANVRFYLELFGISLVAHMHLSDCHFVWLKGV